MFSSAPGSPGDAPQVWMELFDHDAKRSIDSCSCGEIDDAMSAFEVLVAQVENSNGTFGPEVDEPEV